MLYNYVHILILYVSLDLFPSVQFHLLVKFHFDNKLLTKANFH